MSCRHLHSSASHFLGHPIIQPATRQNKQPKAQTRWGEDSSEPRSAFPEFRVPVLPSSISDLPPFPSVFRAPPKTGCQKVPKSARKCQKVPESAILASNPIFHHRASASQREIIPSAWLAAQAIDRCSYFFTTGH
jgi:hypothetical protein